MRTYAKTWPDRVWAVEGANGAGRPLAQRLLEDGKGVNVTSNAVLNEDSAFFAP